MDSSKKNSTLDKNFLINTITNANVLQPQNNLQMPQLALRCAQFFHSLSQYCLHFYKNYNKEADVQKTKLIKKAQKSRKDKHDKKSKHSQSKKKDFLLRGQNQPQPPKKPLTAYIIYFQDKKPSFAQKFPSLSLSQLTKLIAKDWKQLNDSQKKPYLDKAADDRKRYQGQMIDFREKYNKKQSGVDQISNQASKTNKVQIGQIQVPNIEENQNRNEMEVQGEQEKPDIQQQKRESNQNADIEQELENQNNESQNQNQNQIENGEEEQNNSQQQVDAQADADADQQNQEQDENDDDVENINDNDVDNDNEEGAEQSQK